MPVTTRPVPRTVFVLGAGASKEAGLPMGAELKGQIAKVVDIRFENGLRQNSGDHLITEALRLAGAAESPPAKSINPYLHAGWRIRDAMPQAISIDNFIDAHADDPKIELCGKLAIARTILQSETKSILFNDSRSGQFKLKFEKAEKTWFNAFFQLLTENCRRGGLEKRLESVAMVVFNYDRCIEHYLFHALQNYYGIPGPEAALVMSHLEVHHPYGQVGDLPWANPRSNIEFGTDPNSRQLLDVAKQIKTFTEGTDPAAPEFHRITELMREAPQIVFLGFAFHRLNLDLLFPAPTAAVTNRSMFGTAYGLSQSDVDHIGNHLVERGAVGRHRVSLGRELTCAGLFQEYWRALSLV